MTIMSVTLDGPSYAEDTMYPALAGSLLDDQQESSGLYRLHRYTDNQNESEGDAITDESWAAERAAMKTDIAAEKVAIETAMAATCAVEMPPGYETGFALLDATHLGDGRSETAATLLTGADHTVMVAMLVHEADPARNGRDADTGEEPGSWRYFEAYVFRLVATDRETDLVRNRDTAMSNWRVRQDVVIGFIVPSRNPDPSLGKHHLFEGELIVSSHAEDLVQTLAGAKHYLAEAAKAQFTCQSRCIATKEMGLFDRARSN